MLVNDIRENLFKLSLSNEYIQYVQALIVDVDDIENMRGQRTLDIDEPVATIFWVISVLGYVFTSLCFFVYRATWPRCAVLAMFASINGIVLYSIIALTHPFVGGAAITPTALETVLARTMAAGP